ncbi:hypothetical protein BJ878DRAFT_175417 [Calycina marina]|uniref:CFEM domain-containing protein n=1 Tax=Calycina marina TaxID=1763456 RepID=A0A9P7YZA1_9HELO|nr:hypothetical protein BJ878DRAFT_175417 [Calycina marina]
MKATFLAAAFAAITSVCTAQAPAGLPSCAQGCVVKFTSGSSIGNCQSSDAKCICSSSSFLGDISCCLTSVCSADDQQTAIDYAVSFCKISGVTGLPTAVVCSSSTAGGTSASSTSDAASSGTTSAPGSSSTSDHSTITSSPTSAAAVSTTSSTSSTTTPNAGSANINAVGVGAGLGILAFVALL